MSQPPISASQFRELHPGSPEASAEWSVFSVQVIEPAVRTMAAFSDHVVGLQLSGTCRLRKDGGARSVEGWSGPGCVSITPALLEGTWEGREYSGASRAIVLFVPDVFLARVIVQDWDVDPRNVEILDRFLARDPVMEGVLTRLAFEARNHSPSGELYAQSACEFLAHHLVRTHSSLAAPPPPTGGLPARRLKLVLEYIEENLAQSLTLFRLAELAGVSARHFERAFRQARGVPPHAYVLQKRVERARHLLVSQPTLTIHEVALQVGFSSSSHLALNFRRFTGYSPATFRRLMEDKNLA